MSLHTWKLKKWLTLEQAASLAIRDKEGKLTPSQDEESSVLLSVLAEAVENAEFDNEDIHQPNNLDVSLHTHVGYQTEIRVKALQEWFIARQYPSEFFNPNNEYQDVIPDSDSSSSYRTRLMKIMDEAIARFYGKNFDINDRDSHPTQQKVITWLRDEFSLSNKQAECIEIIISPRSGNYLEGNE